MAVQYFRCKTCGKIIEIINAGALTTVCCGEDMIELIANTTDGAQEKHVPVIEQNGATVTVKVGAAAHPMESDHYIQWIALETNKGVQRKHLQPGDAPTATFALADETLLAAYSYCNKHGLWKAAV